MWRVGYHPGTLWWSARPKSKISKPLWKIKKNLRIEKNRKKISKIDFFESVKKWLPGVPKCARECSGGGLGPLEAISDQFEKIDFFDFFSKIFDFRNFLVFHNGLLIFDSGLADHHRVPAGYPNQHFSESWASGEHILALVCHCRASFRPLPTGFPKSSEHPLRWIF